MADQVDGKDTEEGLPVNKKLHKGIGLYKGKLFDASLSEFLSLDSKDFKSDDKAELHYYLGLCYTKLEQFDEALIYLEQVVTSSNDVYRTFQCRMMLAYIYVITKRIKMAEFELNRLQASGFESAILYNTLAYAALSQKKTRNAVELYEKALEIDSVNTTAMNNMGYILADTGIDVIRGLRLCKKAVDVKPQSPAYLDSLGWAYYQSGELIEARTWLRRAMELAPKANEIRRHFELVTGEKVEKK